MGMTPQENARYTLDNFKLQRDGATLAHFNAWCSEALRNEVCDVLNKSRRQAGGYTAQGEQLFCDGKYVQSITDAEELAAALNETARLQARVDAFVQALGCHLCPDDALATIDLKNAALEAYEARVEQLERGICETHKERLPGTVGCMVCEWLASCSGENLVRLERDRDTLTQERDNLTTYREGFRTEKTWRESAQREAEALRTALRNLLAFVRNIFGPKYDKEPQLVDADTVLSGERPEKADAQTSGRVVEEKGVTKSVLCPECGGRPFRVKKYTDDVRVCPTCKGTGVERKA